MAAMQNLQIIKQDLDIPDDCAHTDLEQYKKTLTTYFHEGWPLMTADRLGKDEVYQNWRQCSTSSCLLLHGLTQTNSTRKSLHSWLSLAAMEVTEELRKQKKHVANYFCHHEGITPWIHIRALMWSLVFQILRSKPDILLKDLTEIRHRITTCNKEDDDKALEDMFKTMDRVLQSFGGKQDVLYLIIDRLDNSEPQHLHEGLLNKFFNLVREAPCTIKVMVVVESTEWKVKVSTCEDIQNNSDNYLACRLEWDQECPWI